LENISNGKKSRKKRFDGVKCVEIIFVTGIAGKLEGMSGNNSGSKKPQKIPPLVHNV
jgi:hypothetical protein